MKRILTIQDISCLGKCSLTVALPLISAMGVEGVILPTAVLSTHTMFNGFTVKDLSDQIEPITNHWKNENIKFDALYTGYLGTVAQIHQMKDLFNKFKTEDNFIFIDPVMADNGKLYPAFNEEYVEENAKLCALADVIVPNITEAAFMTHSEYKETYDEAYIKDLLYKLAKLGSKIVVITGVSLKEGMTGVYGYDTRTKEFFQVENKKVDASYHGTGDIFSSVSVAALMNGLSLKDSFKLAADFTAKTIETTINNPKNPGYGVDFETEIPYLVKTLSEYKKSVK